MGGLSSIPSPLRPAETNVARIGLKPCVAAALLLAALPAQAVGPGLGNRTWAPSEVFRPAGFIQSPEGHGNVTMVQGYLMVITSSDGGGSPDDGGIEFWDVSNPAAPTLAIRHDTAETHGLREAHGFTLAWFGTRLILAAQGITGIQLWDVTDPMTVVLLSALSLPGINGGDYSGDWWTFFQAPWLYVAGVDGGLFVVDAHDPAQPRLARQMTTGDLAGLTPAQVFAVGNLLVLLEVQSTGMATLDISTPSAPRLLRRMDGRPGYSHILAADGKILTSGNIPPQVSVHQLTPAGGVTHVTTFAFHLNSGGYGSYQDGKFHSGFSDRYIKFDLATRASVGNGSSGRNDRDEDFAVVLGNVVFAGNDHGQGTALIPHQEGADLEPPVVEWMHPPSASTGAAPSSRFGLSFSDHVDVASLTPDTLYLVDDMGARVPAQRSSQLGLVNLSPDAPLLPSRVYTLVAEGVRDVAGNASPRFEGTITTGDGSSSLDPLAVMTNVRSSGLFGAPGVGIFETGAPTYLDRDFAFAAGYPSRLEGSPYIVTRNNDKLAVSATYLQFDLAAPAEVLVLYDQRPSSPPSWLAAFTPTGETVRNNDTTFRVYSRAYPAGAVVLGGNNATGAMGVESMYSVVVVADRLRCSLQLVPAPVGQVSLAVTGPSDATYSWQVGETMLPDAGQNVTVTLPAGRHGVLVNASRGSQVTSCSQVQVVFRPPSSEVPATTTPVLWRGNTVFTVNPDSQTVTSVDAASGRVNFEAGGFAVPVALALQGDALWVLDRKDAAIHVIGADAGEPRRRMALPGGSRPTGLVVDSAGNTFVSLDATGEVLKLDAQGNILQRVFVTPTASGLAVHGGRLYVSRFLSPDSGGEIHVRSTMDLSAVGVIPLVSDDSMDTEASGRGLPNYLSAMVISADGTRGFISAKKDNTGRGLFRDGLPLTFESRVRAIVMTLDLVTQQEVRTARLDVNDREGLHANALSPRGDLLFVTAQGNNRVEVFETDSRRRVAQLVVERAPRGVTVNAQGDRLAVQNVLSRSVSVLDVGGLVAGTNNGAPLVQRVETVAQELLPPEVLAGKIVFHDAADRRMSKDGYIACASCHQDGGHDGRTWDFTQAGEGLRNTISLQGRAGMGHGRVHWTANFDEIQDFENDIRNAFGGTGFLTDADWLATQDPLGATKAGRSTELDALAAYVSSLTSVPESPHREANGAVTDAARRGRQVFLDADCQRCHAGNTFSDHQRHDVGTVMQGSGQGIGMPLAGVGFDTPTLRGIFDTAPYFHNGSAPTLDAVLTAHGEVPVFSDQDRADLVAYLLSLDERSGAPDAACGLTDECVRQPAPDAGTTPDGGGSNADGGAGTTADAAVPPGGDPGAAPNGCACGVMTPQPPGVLLLAVLWRWRRRHGCR